MKKALLITIPAVVIVVALIAALTQTPSNTTSTTNTATTQTSSGTGVQNGNGNGNGYKAGTNTTNSTDTTATTNNGTYTLAEVAQHNTASDCWMVIDGDVLDVTDYIASGQHVPQIVDGCGLDATAMFNAERKHNSPKAQRLLPEFTIGTLN